MLKKLKHKKKKKSREQCNPLVNIAETRKKAVSCCF